MTLETGEQKKLYPVRFDFNIRVKEVKPWIASTVPLVLQWQRGKTRSGLSQPLQASIDEEEKNGLWKLSIDALFRVSATLYSEDDFSTIENDPIHYRKKHVVFKLYEADERDGSMKGHPIMGRFILDLSAFGNLNQNELLSRNIPLTYSFTEDPCPEETSVKLWLSVECVKKKGSSSLSITLSSLDCSEKQEDDGETSETTTKADDGEEEETDREIPSSKLSIPTDPENIYFLKLEESVFDRKAVENASASNDRVRIDLEEERQNLEREFQILDSMRSELLEEKERISEMAMEILTAIEKASIAEERAKTIEMKYRRMPGEVRDASLSELAVYSIQSDHGQSFSSLHTPARRLARAFLHALQHEVCDSVTGVAETMLSSLLLVSRACGDDTSKLVFWWSNAVMLREIISQMMTSNCLEKEVVSSSFEFGSISSVNSCHSASFKSVQNEYSISENSRNQTNQINQDVYDEGENSTSCSITSRGMGFENQPTNSGSECEDGLGKSAYHNKDGKWNDPVFVSKMILDLENHLHQRILDLIWTQMFLPLMSAPISNDDCDSNLSSSKTKKNVCKSKIEFDMKLLRTKLSGVERWRAVLTESYARLCPHRWMNSDCGCISSLSKQIMRQSAARLDAVLFNALVRGEGDWEEGGKEEADPILDPLSLPFPPGTLSFNRGIELKKAISTWSDVLMEIENTTENTNAHGSKNAQQLLSILTPSTNLNPVCDHYVQSKPIALPPRKSKEKYFLTSPVQDPSPLSLHSRESSMESNLSDMAKPDSKLHPRRDGSSSPDSDRDFFPMLKSMADLLMLPKELLLDPTVRKEACGALTPHLIRRIVFLFVPDENAPDYISPTLLGALNSEVKLVSKGKLNASELNKAPFPHTPYTSPASEKVRILINHFGLSLNTSMELTIEKGELSDEEMDINEVPLALLHGRRKGNGKLSKSHSGSNSFRKSMGYKLLRRVWKDHEQSLVFE